MLQQKSTRYGAGAVAVLFAIAIASRSAIAEKDGDTSVGNPQIRAALAEDQTREILLLMSPGENGKISEQAFIQFMKAEFKRLDPRQSGQVDAKELEYLRPQVIPSSQLGK
jgi:hypothetical protein